MTKLDEERRLENIWGAISLATVDKMEQAFATAIDRGPSATAALIQTGVEPGLSIERLRRILALSHSATVRLVDQLVADGLVSREASSGPDKRERALYLTPLGEARYDAARNARLRVSAAALARLTERERRNLAGMIEKMFPALVDAGDDSNVVCRLCGDEGICPLNRCPAAHGGEE